MKIKIKPFVGALLLFTLMMQIVFQEKIVFLQYLDECVAVFAFIYIVINALRRKNRKSKIFRFYYCNKHFWTGND